MKTISVFFVVHNTVSQSQLKDFQRARTLSLVHAAAKDTIALEVVTAALFRLQGRVVVILMDRGSLHLLAIGEL